MIIEPDRLDLARRSTLISHATGADLARLCELYGLAWTARTTDEAAQRATLRATLYSARGTPQALTRTLRAIYAHLEESATGATLTPAALPTLTHASLDASSAGAWVEVIEETGAARLYHIAHAIEGEATLTPARTAYHHAPPKTGAPREVSFKVLPFTLREPHPDSIGRAGGIARPCEVILSARRALTPAPPTYLREAGDARALGEPLGGHVMSFTAPESSRGSQVSGPYPLYMTPGDSLSATLRAFIEGLLAAGVKLSGEVSA